MPQTSHLHTPTPHMLEDEVALYERYLSECRHLLEFGCGQSTIYTLSHYNEVDVTSVETDRKYLDALRHEQIIERKIEEGKCKLIHADIGEVGVWGYPKSADDKLIWLNYTLHLWPKLPAHCDLILIDGRFRLCTALLGLMYAPNAIFAFHDFSSRQYYFPLLKYIDVLDIAASLLIYSLKPGSSTSRILNDISASLMDAR